MKKHISSFSAIAVIALLVAFMSLSFTKATNITNQPKNLLIRYAVAVYPPSDNATQCGSYIVMMVNSAGQIVAPAQQYSMAVTNYYFYELGPVFGGTRTARLVSGTLDAFDICSNPWVTEPKTINDNFLNGNTYHFELFPLPKGLHE